jgi:hypothetical protein
MYKTLINYVDHLFLLMIILSGYLIGESTFNKKLHTFIKNDHIIINILLIITLFFTFDFRNRYEVIKHKDKLYDPITTFKNTIIIWILYLCIMKMDLSYLLVSIFILLIIYILENYKLYNQEKLNTRHIDILSNIQIIMINIFIVMVIINLINHYQKNKNKSLVELFFKN